MKGQPRLSNTAGNKSRCQAVKWGDQFSLSIAQRELLNKSVLYPTEEEAQLGQCWAFKDIF